MNRSDARRPSFDVTIDDVAAAAGVSSRTVSRVLNNSPKVSAKTRARVEAVAAELNWRPSWRARGLATGRSYLLGLMHDEHNAVVLGEMLRGAVRKAADRGYEIIVHPTAIGGIDPLRDAVDFVQRSRVDGALVLAPLSGVEGLAAALSASGVKTCALSALMVPGFGSTLVYDERRAAARAAQHLIDLGHRRIALMSGPDLISARERRIGFVETLAKAGLKPVGEVQGDYSFESGVVGAEDLFALSPRPTAIISANDAMAAGILKVAARLGVAVPHQLSVVGFDNLLARMLTPALTTVHRNMSEIAEAGVSRLIDMIEGLSSTKDFNPEFPLIISESSGPPPA